MAGRQMQQNSTWMLNEFVWSDKARIRPLQTRESLLNLHFPQRNKDTTPPQHSFIGMPFNWFVYFNFSLVWNTIYCTGPVHSFCSSELLKVKECTDTYLKVLSSNKAGEHFQHYCPGETDTVYQFESVTVTACDVCCHKRNYFLLFHFHLSSTTYLSVLCVGCVCIFSKL